MKSCALVLGAPLPCGLEVVTGTKRVPRCCDGVKAIPLSVPLSLGLNVPLAARRQLLGAGAVAVSTLYAFVEAVASRNSCTPRARGSIPIEVGLTDCGNWMVSTRGAPTSSHQPVLKSPSSAAVAGQFV